MSENGNSRPPKKALASTLAKQNAFLKVFASLGVIGRSAEKAGIHRDSHLRWLGEDPDYAKRFEIAQKEAVESLETEMIRRGRDGYLEPVFYQGEECGEIRKFSDTLLIFALKGLAPDRYRERFELPAVPVGGNITTNVQINVSGLSEEKLRDFLDVSAKLLDGSAAQGSPPSGPAGARPAEPR